MIVLPGGGYAAHAAHEAEPVAGWLRGLGIAASVFRYPLNVRHPVPRDALLREIRDRRAAGAGRVGLIGFSAGGHLAGRAALAPGAGAAEAVQLAVLGYPITSMETETYRPSRLILLGEDASPPARRSGSTCSPTGLTASVWPKGRGTRRPGPPWPPPGYASTPEPPEDRQHRPRSRACCPSGAARARHRPGFRYLQFSVSYRRAGLQQPQGRDRHDCVPVRGRADEPAHGRQGATTVNRPAEPRWRRVYERRGRGIR